MKETGWEKNSLRDWRLKKVEKMHNTFDVNKKWFEVDEEG